jgi:hypothetical protein
MKLSKAIAIIIFTSFICTLVAAGLMTYIGKLQTNITVEQPVRLDWVNYNKLVVDNVTGIGGNTVKRNHTLEIRCDDSVNLTIVTKAVAGILVYYEYYEGVVCHSLTNPQLLEPGIYTITFCYELDLNLIPTKYILTSTLSVTK